MLSVKNGAQTIVGLARAWMTGNWDGGSATGGGAAS